MVGSAVRPQLCESDVRTHFAANLAPGKYAASPVSTARGRVVLLCVAMYVRVPHCQQRRYMWRELCMYTRTQNYAIEDSVGTVLARVESHLGPVIAVRLSEW